MADASPSPLRRSLSGLRLWLFAAPNFPLSAVTIAIAVYVPQHFAKHLGLGLASVGAAFGLVRLIDIPVDPLLGVAMDRTATRWGRYRAWLVLGGPILIAAVYMLFMAQPGITFAYVIIWALALYLGTSILGLSHTAWAATIATSYNERSRVFGAFGASSVAGMSMVLGVPLLVGLLLHGARGAGVPEMGWFIIITIPLAVIACISAADERVTPQAPSRGFAMRDYWGVLTNPHMVRVALAALFFTLGQSWEGGLYMFYITDVRHFTDGEASLLLMASLAAGLFGAPAISGLATRTSKHAALFIISSAYAVAVLSLAVIPLAPKWVVYIPYLTSGFLYAGFLILLRAMTADIADEIRLAQGKERSALLYGVLTLTPKISAAVAIWMTFALLADMNYRPALGAANTAGAIEGLRLAYIFGPNICVLIGSLCLVGYKLTRGRVAENRRRLDEQDEHGSAPEMLALARDAAAGIG